MNVYFWPHVGEVCHVNAHVVSLAILLKGIMLHKEAAHINVVICKIP